VKNVTKTNQMKKNLSQSPVPPKKESNKIVTNLSFPNAIQAIINGKKVRRVEWSSLKEYGLLKDNFLMIHRNGKFHTWIVSEGDLLAIDWVIVN